MDLNGCTSLSALAETLGRHTGDIDEGSFSRLIARSVELGVDRVAIADDFTVSVGTVGRWSTGASAPAGLIRNMAPEVLLPLVYFAMIEKCKSKQELATTLRTVASREVQDFVFAAVFRKALELGIERIALARRLKVPLPTIGRWSTGESCPVPIGRPSAIISVADIAGT